MRVGPASANCQSSLVADAHLPRYLPTVTRFAPSDRYARRRVARTSPRCTPIHPGRHAVRSSSMNSPWHKSFALLACHWFCQRLVAARRALAKPVTHDILLVVKNLHFDTPAERPTALRPAPRLAPRPPSHTPRTPARTARRRWAASRRRRQFRRRAYSP